MLYNKKTVQHIKQIKSLNQNIFEFTQTFPGKYIMIIELFLWCFSSSSRNPIVWYLCQNHSLIFINYIYMQSWENTMMFYFLSFVPFWNHSGWTRFFHIIFNRSFDYLNMFIIYFYRTYIRTEMLILRSRSIIMIIIYANESFAYFLI